MPVVSLAKAQLASSGYDCSRLHLNLPVCLEELESLYLEVQENDVDPPMMDMMARHPSVGPTEAPTLEMATCCAAVAGLPFQKSMRDHRS
mmetsp:Transcript_12822/g.25166  ORF Transcript_12822/g.25166 Transcript_12822/m.25166 type:complete len:90 (+) Transcript_12822:455-724(+)